METVYRPMPSGSIHRRSARARPPDNTKEEHRSPSAVVGRLIIRLFTGSSASGVCGPWAEHLHELSERVGPEDQPLLLGERLETPFEERG
jgi:hypothetical protein